MRDVGAEEGPRIASDGRYIQTKGESFSKIRPEVISVLRTYNLETEY